MQTPEAPPAPPARTPSCVSAASSVGPGGSDLACEDCGKVLASSKLLREHVAQHKWGPHEVIRRADGRTVFRCLFEKCGKMVKDRKVLRKHLLTHKPREFVCPVPGCGKRFYERAKLKRHNLVHTGEKDFVCTYPGCDKKFAYKANLKTHIRTHTGHRPYACTYPGCNKSFAQASNRNSHMLTHTHTKAKRKVPEPVSPPPANAASNISNANPATPFCSNAAAAAATFRHSQNPTAADAAALAARKGNTVLATAQARLLPPAKARKLNDLSSPQNMTAATASLPDTERPAFLDVPVSPLIAARQPEAPRISNAFLEATSGGSKSHNNNGNFAHTETVRSLLSLGGGGESPPPSTLSESTAPRKHPGGISSLDKMADLVQLTAQKNKLASSSAVNNAKKLPLRQHSSSQQPRVSIPALPRVPAASPPSHAISATTASADAPATSTKSGASSTSFFEDLMAKLKMSSSGSSMDDATPASSPLAHLLSPSARAEDENHHFSAPIFPSSAVFSMMSNSSNNSPDASFVQQLLMKSDNAAAASNPRRFFVGTSPS